MAPRLVVAMVFLALSSGCATPRVIRLNVGRAEPLEYRPPSAYEPTQVGPASFEDALERWVLAVPLALPSPEPGRLVRASYRSDDAEGRWQRLMSKSFGGLCAEGQRRANCLSLLDDVLELSEWDKLGISLALSLEPLKQSISQAVERTLAPQLFYAVISASLVTWVMLAANPEPVFTKAAAIISAVLLIYLGVDTFLELVEASRELKRATGRATVPRELEQAGQHFARRLGPEVARVAVLAVTVGVSLGMTGGAALLASRLPMLPHFSEAAVMGASRAGLQLASVGEVSAVAVSAEGTITLTVPATAVAIATTGSGGAITVKDTHIHVPKHGLDRLAPTWAEQRQILIDTVRQLDGKVAAVATAPQGAVFESTVQLKGTLGKLVNLTIRWFRYADGSITINTAFIPP